MWLVESSAKRQELPELAVAVVQHGRAAFLDQVVLEVVDVADAARRDPSA